jgi:hypothetical protein
MVALALVTLVNISQIFFFFLLLGRQRKSKVQPLMLMLAFWEHFENYFKGILWDMTNILKGVILGVFYMVICFI